MCNCRCSDLRLRWGEKLIEHILNPESPRCNAANGYAEQTDKKYHKNNVFVNKLNFCKLWRFFNLFSFFQICHFLQHQDPNIPSLTPPSALDDLAAASAAVPDSAHPHFIIHPGLPRQPLWAGSTIKALSIRRPCSSAVTVLLLGSNIVPDSRLSAGI